MSLPPKKYANLFGTILSNSWGRAGEMMFLLKNRIKLDSLKRNTLCLILKSIGHLFGPDPTMCVAKPLIQCLPEYPASALAISQPAQLMNQRFVMCFKPGFFCQNFLHKVWVLGIFYCVQGFCPPVVILCYTDKTDQCRV